MNNCYDCAWAHVPGKPYRRRVRLSRLPGLIVGIANLVIRHTKAIERFRIPHIERGIALQAFGQIGVGDIVLAKGNRVYMPVRGEILLCSIIHNQFAVLPRRAHPVASANAITPELGEFQIVPQFSHGRAALPASDGLVR